MLLCFQRTRIPGVMFAGFCNSRCSLCSRKGGAPRMTCDAVLHATALAVAPTVLRIVEVGNFRVSCRQNQAGNLRHGVTEVYSVQWKKRLQSRAGTSDLCFRAFPEVVKDEQKCYEIREMLRRSGMEHTRISVLKGVWTQCHLSPCTPHLSTLFAGFSFCSQNPCVKTCQRLCRQPE